VLIKTALDLGHNVLISAAFHPKSNIVVVQQKEKKTLKQILVYTPLSSDSHICIHMSPEIMQFRQLCNSLGNCAIPGLLQIP
jgi:hypothetical protein